MINKFSFTIFHAHVDYQQVSLDKFLMARYYGQKIETSLNQCHVNLHPFNTKYISVMYNERCSMQRYASKRSAVKLKDEETNVIQVFDVR